MIAATVLTVVFVAAVAKSAGHDEARVAVAGQGGAQTAVCKGVPWKGQPYFSPASPINQPIAAGAAVDPNSAIMVAALARAGADRDFVLSVGAFTVPVYFAAAATPRRNVMLNASFARRTAPGQPPILTRVPIPVGARPDPGSDGHMAIIDTAAGCEYDFWQASKNSQGMWQATWANRTSLAGNGIFSRLSPGARASGFALTAGLIFPVELRNGQINHALTIAIPNTRKGAPAPPATRSDGQTLAPEGIPMGARLQLDPTLDLSKLDLPAYEQTIARALQVYGAFVADTGGAVSLYAVNRVAYRVDPYASVLPSDKYIGLDGIPLDRFRVLVPPPA